MRYCARPPFAMDRLRKEGSKLVYRCGKQRSEPTSDKRGAKVDELHLTPLELIDRIAALVPPPRTHRHRYFGVLAPNSPLRAAVTALATPAQAAPVLGASISTGECAPGVVPMSSALPSLSEPVLPKRAAHYLWAVLIARIYEVFPLKWPTAAAPTCRRSASNGLAPHAKWPSGLAHHAWCVAASGVFLFRLAWPCASLGGGALLVHQHFQAAFLIHIGKCRRVGQALDELQRGRFGLDGVAQKLAAQLRGVQA